MYAIRSYYEEKDMQIGVAYSEPAQQIWLTIDVPDGATVGDAIERSA